MSVIAAFSIANAKGNEVITAACSFEEYQHICKVQRGNFSGFSQGLGKIAV